MSLCHVIRHKEMIGNIIYNWMITHPISWVESSYITDRQRWLGLWPETNRRTSSASSMDFRRIWQSASGSWPKGSFVDIIDVSFISSQCHSNTELCQAICTCASPSSHYTTAIWAWGQTRVMRPYQPQTLHHESQSVPNLYVTAFTTVILFFSLNKKYA